MASEVEICKLALGHLADAARINSISPPDASIQAQHCATYYPIARDACLESYPWPFATTMGALAASLVAPADGEWGYAYSMPVSYLKVLRVVPPGAAKDHPGVDFAVRSDINEQDLVLYTNIQPANLHYIFREEETGRYSPLFISALSYLLGSYLAGPIIKGRVGMQVKQSLYQQYLAEISQAATRQLASAGQRSEAYAGYKPTWITDR